MKTVPLKVTTFRLLVPAGEYTAPTAVLVYELPAREDGVVFTYPRFIVALASGQTAITQGQIWPSACQMSATDAGHVNLILNLSAAAATIENSYVEIFLIERGTTVEVPISPL